MGGGLRAAALLSQEIMPELIRCAWASTPQMAAYHDNEWGVPVHDDRLLFEFLILEGAQAGLSWSTILAKREGYRKAFAGFDVAKVSRLSDEKIERLLLNPDIVRNRLKVVSTVTNAKLVRSVQNEFGSFDAFMWQFVEGTPKQNAWKKHVQIPPTSPESDRMSRELARRGFKFVGSTICYAFMQAVGMVNDHLTDCYRYRELA